MRASTPLASDRSQTLCWNVSRGVVRSDPAAMAEGLSAAGSRALRAAVLQVLQVLRVALFLLALPFLAAVGFCIAVVGRIFLKSY